MAEPPAGATGSPTSSGLDLRLALPGLVAWAVLVAVVPRPVAVQATVAAVALAATLLALAARPERLRVPRLARTSGRSVAPTGALASWDGAVIERARGALALTAAATSLVCGASAWQAAAAQAGPVPGWAQERAVTQVRLLVTGEPRLIGRADERAPLVVVDATVLAVEARGVHASPRTPVVVFATTEQDAWTQVAWRSEVLVAGRWSPADPGQRAVAVLTPRGPPQPAAEPAAVLRGVDHVRERFRAAVDPLPSDPRGLVPGLVMGDTSLTPPDLTQAMRDTGMTHLSAVSGSNVAIVAGGVAFLAARAGLPRRWRLPAVLVALVGFVLLCRPEPSVLRAGVMGVVGLLALSAGRRRSSLPALGAAVILLLCVDPWLSRSYGFALSTLATLGLVLWARPWGLALARPLPGWAALPARAAAIPLAAQVICAPVIVLLQGSITTVAVLANLLAAPLVPPTTILGVAAALVSPLWLPGAVALAWAAALPAWLIAAVSRACARLPWGTVDWVDGPPGALSLAALTLLLLLTGRWWLAHARRHLWWVWALSCAAVTALLPVPALAPWPPPGWVVVGCDVGQGDAFVLRTGPEAAVLVDVGPDPQAVGRCLRELGIQRVDLLILTHFHADHVAGLGGVLRAVSVERALVTSVADPVETAHATVLDLERAGVPVRTARAGDTMSWGPARIEVVAPPDPPIRGGSAANNASVVIDAEISGVRVLLTGDLEPEATRPVRQGVAGTDYDVLKVAHHGSSAQDESLVRAADPEIALIGVGADNTFGHPSPSALSLLAEVGAVVLRTDLHGSVAVVVDDQGRIVPHARHPGQ